MYIRIDQFVIRETPCSTKCQKTVRNLLVFILLGKNGFDVCPSY